MAATGRSPAAAGAGAAGRPPRRAPGEAPWRRHAISIGTFADDAALQVGMRIFHSGERSQHKLLPFSCQQIPNDQDARLFLWCGAGRKHAGIRAVEDDLGCNCFRHSLVEQPLHPAAYTDHLACALIDVQGGSAAPSCCDALLEATVEDIQTMNGNNKWNARSPRKQRRSVAARQRCMCVDDVNQ